MKENVFTWLAEERLKSEFLAWAMTVRHADFSYSTLARAQSRAEQGEELTKRQGKLERLAIEFRAMKHRGFLKGAPATA